MWNILRKKKNKTKPKKTTNQNFDLFKANTSLPPGGGTAFFQVLSADSLWNLLTKVIANAIVSLLFSACKVVLWSFTFILNGKLRSLISPIFPVYCHHLRSGCHCRNNSMRLTIGFYFGWTGFSVSLCLCLSIYISLSFSLIGGERPGLCAKTFLASFSLWLVDLRKENEAWITLFSSIFISLMHGPRMLEGHRVGTVFFHSDPSEMQKRLQNN